MRILSIIAKVSMNQAVEGSNAAGRIVQQGFVR